MRNPFRKKSRAEKLLSELDTLLIIIERVQHNGKMIQGQLLLNVKEQNELIRAMDEVKEELKKEGITLWE